MTTFPYTSDPATPAQMGLVVLQSDETIELDFRALIPAHVELMVSRVPSGLDVTPDTLQSMAAHITQSAELFPRSARFSVVGYGCTSGTAQIGVTEIARLVQAGCATCAVTEPVSALIRACNHLGLKRIAFLSPYTQSVSDPLRDTLRSSAIDTPVFGTFNEATEEKVVRIDTASVISAATELARGADIDAVFLSCTNLRTLDAIKPLEQALNMPVLSSNLVLAWDMMQSAGVTAPPFGRLLSA